MSTALPPLPPGAEEIPDAPPLPLGAKAVPQPYNLNAPPAFASQEDSLSRFGQGLWNTTGAGLVALGKSAWDVLNYAANNKEELDPETKHMVGDIIQSHADQWSKAKESWGQGDYSEAAGHALATIIPLIGPAAAHAGESFGSTPPTYDKYGNVITSGQAPNVAGGVGESAGLLAPYAVRGTTAAARSLTKDMPRVDPAVAVNRIYRPGPADADFPEIAPRAVSDVKTNAAAPIRSNADVIQAANDTITSHQAALDPWMNRARAAHVQISTDPLVAATRDALSSATQLEDPAQAAAIVKNAQNAYGGRTFNVDQMRRLLKDKNAELDSFYQKAQGKQAAAIQSGAPMAVVLAQRNAIADALYRALDPEHGGAGPREIQLRTGNVIDLRDAAVRRSNAILAEKPLSPAESVGRIGAGLAGVPGKFMHGDIEGIYKSLMHPWQGPTDPLIGRLFGGAEESSPLPQPMGDYPRQLALPPGAIITPPPEGFSGIKVTTGKPLRVPLSRQLPQGPTVRAPSELSGPAGDITDVVPVKNLVTGKIEYVPRPRPPTIPPPGAGYARGGSVLNRWPGRKEQLRALGR